VNATGQLELPTPLAYRTKVAWREQVLPLVRELAAAMGRKELAWELDVRHSYIDNVLTESSNYRLKAEELVHLLLREDGGRLLELLAELCGHQVQRCKPLTDGEKLERLRRKLHELGPLGDQIIREATGE
jgi:hypothetical protein